MDRATAVRAPNNAPFPFWYALGAFFFLMPLYVVFAVGMVDLALGNISIGGEWIVPPGLVDPKTYQGFYALWLLATLMGLWNYTVAPTFFGALLFWLTRRIFAHHRLCNTSVIARVAASAFMAAASEEIACVILHFVFTAAANNISDVPPLKPWWALIHGYALAGIPTGAISEIVWQVWKRT